MANPQVQRDFVALLQAFMADDKARAKFDAFLDKTRGPDLVDCVATFFVEAKNYAASNGKLAMVFTSVVKAALRKTDQYIALRVEVLTARKDTEWYRYYQTLDAQQRKTVQSAISSGKARMSRSEAKYLKLFADYMKRVNRTTFTEYIMALAASPLSDCMKIYIEASQAYDDTNIDSLTIFWGTLSRALGICDGSFAAQVDANRKVSGSVWQRRYLGLEGYQRLEIDRQIAEKAHGMTADATTAARDDEAEASRARTPTQKKFLRLLAAAMGESATSERLLHALTDWLTALKNFRELSECIEAYIDAPAKLSNDSDRSVQIFYGLVSLAIAKGPVYFALKYQEQIKAAGSVWQQRRAAMKGYELTGIETEIKRAMTRVRLTDLWRIAYYREHRRDPDDRRLVTYAPALPDDVKKSLDSLISDADVAWGASSYERMNKTIEQFADLFKAQSDPMILVAMLHRIRDRARLDQLLRDELYWCGQLHLNVWLMASGKFAMQYKNGFSDEEIKLLAHGIGARNRYVTDFALRLQYATDKRSNRLEIGDLCKSHLILLMLARQWNMALVPMAEAKKIHDEVEAWRQRYRGKGDDIEIPVASRFDRDARVRVGETLGNLFVVWYHRKDGSVFLEMKDLERVLFEVDNYHRLGRIRDDDKTYGQIYRNTAHLLVLIPVFFEIMMYLPDLVSGGFTGLVKSIVINYASEFVTEQVGGGTGTNLAVSTVLSLATGHGKAPDADDVARGLATDAKAAARAGEEHIAKMATVADDALSHSLARAGGSADDALQHLGTRATASVDDAAQHTLARGAGQADKAVTHAVDDVGTRLGTPPRADVVTPTARATPAPQKLLAAPKYPPSVLDTAKVVGLEPDQVAALAGLLGKDFDGAAMREFTTIWNQARRNHLAGIEDVQRMFANRAATRDITERAREVFDGIRDDFWQLVRNGQSLECRAVRDRMAQAGMTFLGDATAPIVTMRTSQGWSNVQVHVDHIAELGQQPMKAFSPNNFRLALRDENVILLNQMHAQDAFLQDARLRAGNGASRAAKMLGDPNYRGKSPKRGLLADPNAPQNFQADIDAALEGMIERL